MFKLAGASKIAGAIVIAVVFFYGTLWALDFLTPTVAPPQTATANTPPLPPAARSSVVMVPVAIAIPALRQVLEQGAPRSLSGKPETPIAKILSKAEIAYTIDRSPLTLTGRADGLTIGADLSGALRITGQLSDQISHIVGALTGVASDPQVRGAKDRPLDLRADLKGHMAVTSRPKITTGWRLEANLVGRTDLADVNIQLGGVKLNGAREVKSLIDRAMSDQMVALAARIREDLFIENAARREWAKMCRSIPLGSSAEGLPPLWLETRPTRAFAAQPRVDANNITVTLGVQADTRIVPQETKPDCPFPTKLDLVPALDQGKIAIGVPVDVPFTEVNRLLDMRLRGKTFPADGSGAGEITVQSITASAAGDRLVISMRVKATERKSWFSFGGDATIHVTGKPVLDQERQLLRMEHVALSVESEAAFGLLGAAAKAAMPHLQNALASHAIIDLRPALANARRSIDKALSDFRVQGDGVKTDAQITGLRLTGVEFDSNVVRVTAEIDGVARVAVSKLPEKGR